MTDQQWHTLLAVLEGERVEPIPVGFIIDSPWLPSRAGMSMMGYFTNEEMWFRANVKAVHQFPEVMFLPGFWSEFGMCTEPSAFGAKCVWSETEFPFPERLAAGAVADLAKPNPRTHGLLPFVLKRLQHYESRIRSEGHAIRFAVSRGPLNIASFLAGNTEFLLALMTDPDDVHSVLRTVTDFIVDWLRVQANTFETIDGVLILDDISGFLGDDQFTEFCLPYLKSIYGALDVPVKFLHNDARGLVCAPYLHEIGVNLFNFSYEHSLGEMRQLVGESVTLVGNIAPRDVLAAGTPDAVRAAALAALGSIGDTSRIILSCGGGMPPDVPTENIVAFCEAAQELA